MAINANWGRLVEGEFSHAESYIVHDGRIIINPTDEERIAAGEIPMANNAPETRDGMVALRTGYEARDGQIWSVYEYSEIVPEPRTFSKLKLLKSLGSRNLASPFLQWIAESGHEPLWLAAQDLNEGYDGFGGIVAQVKGALGITDETVEAILAEAVQ